MRSSAQSSQPRNDMQETTILNLPPIPADYALVSEPSEMQGQCYYCAPGDYEWWQMPEHNKPRENLIYIRPLDGVGRIFPHRLPLKP